MSNNTARKKNQVAAHERYVFKPGLGSSHSWAMGKIDDLSKDSALLDVGPGSGALGEYAKNTSINIRHAIEIDQDTIDLLLPLYNSIEKESSKFEDQAFDCILLLDILEHIPETEKFFEDLVRTLKPGGEILISVPNIAHWTIRLSLLLGRFDYTERGLLDKTHYRFFTKKTLKKFIAEDPSLNILSFSGSVSPAELVLPDFISKSPLFTLFTKIRMLGVKLIPCLCSYQLLVHVKKKDLS